MTLYRFARSLIESYAPRRKPGYVDAVVKASVETDGETVALTREDYVRIADEYAICGVGCHLARIFAWFGLKDDGTCGCAAYAAKMDAWGPDGCTEREDEIVGHLAEMAVRRGLPFVPIAARLAVRQAVANARRDAAPAPADAGPG